MTDYEILEQLKKIQSICLPAPINTAYNERVLSSISEDTKERITSALTIVLNQEEYPESSASVALKLIFRFSRIANNWDAIDKVSTAWLAGHPNLECGVDQDGDPMFWDTLHPEEKVVMMPITVLTQE